MTSELRACISRCRTALMTVGMLSAASSILALTGSIFMLAVYDRVIPSGSIPSLVALGILVTAMYLLQAGVDVLRGRMLTRVGMVIKESLGPRVYDVTVRTASQGNLRGAGSVRDLDQVQGFLSSMGPTAMFDLPWLPIYLGICFLFHFYIGLAVTVGALILIALTVLNNMATKSPSRSLNEAMNRREAMMMASQANAETLQAMGMTLWTSAIWNKLSDDVIRASRRIADITNMLGSVSRTFRMLLQSFVLAVGAYLVMQQQATGGIMIASSILSARALAPIELTIAHWKNFISARQSWRRLTEVFDENPAETAKFAAPRPKGSMTCQSVSMAIPGIKRIVVRDVTFDLSAGKGLGIIGPTGSGKSTLARALVGLWQPMIGTVRFDGIELNRWNSVERGRFIGYLPQNVGLFEGTIAENIARFDPDLDTAAVMSAALTAGVHEMIARLPEGYDTKINAGGAGLSGGQAQRIGLARALYRDPFLLVLDEPNSNLDSEGEAALQATISQVKARGGAVIIITHRPSVLSTVDHVLVLQDGRVRLYGPRDEAMEVFAGRNVEANRNTMLQKKGGEAS